MGRGVSLDALYRTERDSAGCRNQPMSEAGCFVRLFSELAYLPISEVDFSIRRIHHPRGAAPAGDPGSALGSVVNVSICF
jgi:hypothetical protein